MGFALVSPSCTSAVDEPKLLLTERKIEKALSLACQIVGLVPLAPARLKRVVNHRISPKGAAEGAARFAAERAAGCNRADAAESIRAFRER